MERDLKGEKKESEEKCIPQQILHSQENPILAEWDCESQQMCERNRNLKVSYAYLLLFEYS